MEIRHYTIKTIGDFIKSDLFLKLDHIPVTKHRAVSHMANPRASGEDKILFVGYDNDQVAGYVGVLPDRIFQQDSGEKTGWLSCFWVAPEHRGKNLSVTLFSHVMEAWNNRILITNMAPGTINFYMRTGFFREPLYKTGLRGYMRFNLSTLLPPKKKIYKNAVPFLKALDFAGNSLNKGRLTFYSRYTIGSHLRIESNESVSAEDENFISRLNGQEFIRRSKPELEWILKYPWILEGKGDDQDSRRYYFSSFAKRFFHQVIKVYDSSDRMVSFFFLSVRNDHLTIPYYYGESGFHEEVVKFLINRMRDLDVSMITVFHKELSETLQHMKSPLLFKKKIVRPYLCPKVLDISGLYFQDGDGDSAFT
jgi:GNAT superfamily N-acetyltransferase